jgi:type IV pilus assembly protein PilC
MPTFAYTARDESGAVATGTLTAASISEVGQMLRGDGKYPVAIQPADASQGTRISAGGRGIKLARNDVIQFSTQLAIMVETGVTLTDALQCIAAQAEKPQLRQLVQDLSQQVQNGSDFSSSLARHPRTFPQLYISLIRASEKSGMLSKLLNRATAYLRDEQETLRRVKGALIYPGIMLSFAVVTTIFLLAFVLPRFTGIYS